MGANGQRRAGSQEGTRRRTPRRWVKTVTTASTTTPPGLFTREAATIARMPASPGASPNGPISGLRMLSFYINRAGRRAGRQLSRSLRAELEKAKRLMRKMIAARRAGG